MEARSEKLMGGGPSWTAVSYNIHRCLGSDGRRDPQRVARVLAGMDADLMGLQEVESREQSSPPSTQLDGFVPPGYEAVAGPTILKEDQTYGNLLLTRLPVLDVALHNLSYPGSEPRGAIEVELEIHGERVVTIVTHLGLSRRERRAQAEQVLGLVDSLPPERTLLVMGDFNEWSFRPRWMRRLEANLGKSPAPRTFPARRPFLALDRIWVRPPDRIRLVESVRTPLARVASDHLPLRALLS